MKVRQWVSVEIGKQAWRCYVEKSLQVRILSCPLTFKFNQMDANQINDIEVNNFDVVSRDFDAVIKQIDIENAKELLRSEGYFVDNLWQTEDVKMNYQCTEEQAQKVLNRVLQYDAIYELVWEGIKYEAENMKLKNKD